MTFLRIPNTALINVALVSTFTIGFCRCDLDFGDFF